MLNRLEIVAKWSILERNDDMKLKSVAIEGWREFGGKLILSKDYHKKGNGDYPLRRITLSFEANHFGCVFKMSRKQHRTPYSTESKSTDAYTHTSSVDLWSRHRMPDLGLGTLSSIEQNWAVYLFLMRISSFLTRILQSLADNSISRWRGRRRCQSRHKKFGYWILKWIFDWRGIFFLSPWTSFTPRCTLDLHISI